MDIAVGQVNSVDTNYGMALEYHTYSLTHLIPCFSIAAHCCVFRNCYSVIRAHLHARLETTECSGCNVLLLLLMPRWRNGRHAVLRATNDGQCAKGRKGIREDEEV